MSFFLAQTTFFLVCVFYAYYSLTMSLNLNKIFIKNKVNSPIKILTIHINNFFINFLIIILIAQFIFLSTTLIKETTMFNQNFCITNFSISLLACSILLNCFIFIFFKSLIFKKIIFLNLDFLFSTSLICFLAPYIFFQNNLISLFLFLELLNILFFFNFVTYTSQSNKKLNLKNNYNYFLNLVFFQFWISFFSSIILLWCILNILLYLGTTEFFYINYLIHNLQFFNFNIIAHLFIFSILLKIGIAPLHFLKIELYKNLSYLNIYLFSCFYFIYFINFFYFFFVFKLPIFFSISIFIIIFVLIIAFYTFFFFFLEVTNFKTFFAFSTVLNFINVVSLIINTFIFV